MLHRLLVPMLVLAAAALAAPAADLPWSDADRARIAAFEAAAVQGRDGLWTVVADGWRARSGISPRFTAELACYLELVERRATALLGLSTGGDPSPCEVTVYADRARYQAALGRPLLSRGQFDWDFGAPPERRFAIRTFVLRPEEREFARFYRPIINHEVGHQLLQSRAGARRIPNLVNEGVATFLQSWDVFEPADRQGQRRREFARELERAVRQKALPPLERLAVADPWDVDGFGAETSTRYACAESFVGWLAEGCDDSRGFLARLLAAALGGGDVLALVRGPGAEWEQRWRGDLASAYSAPQPSGPARAAAAAVRAVAAVGTTP